MRLTLVAAAAALSIAPPSSSTTPSQSRHDRQVIRFFLHHPRLADTPAGRRALWRVLSHVTTQLRQLQAARSAPKSNYQEAREAIIAVFGPYASQAMSVADCESHYDPAAQNGQYEGLFQMGSGERTRYGDGSSWVEQARAAYRYFVASGRDWSPWECKP